ncbi:MAG TPA: DGQHR domain-containing protein DpdB, partial [Longimicrobium sp.]|nr:DGQHR domain-containing protein DpdB [Longimicrobium sp.]
QRLAALRAANVESFMIFITAFVARSEAEQREQFILLNNTKPLPQGLIDELLPSTETDLPLRLDRRRLPSTLVDRLNRDANSPFKGIIKMPTNRRGVVRANSLVRMLDHSYSDGILHHFRNREMRAADLERMIDVLEAYWSAVAEVFEAAWNRSPRESRLMHGAGIVAMGMLMDSIWQRMKPVVPTRKMFHRELLKVREFCHWTHGSWDFGQLGMRPWNQIQNTPGDVQLLSSQICGHYRRQSGGAADETQIAASSEA